MFCVTTAGWAGGRTSRFRVSTASLFSFARMHPCAYPESRRAFFSKSISRGPFAASNTIWVPPAGRVSTGWRVSVGHQQVSQLVQHNSQYSFPMLAATLHATLKYVTRPRLHSDVVVQVGPVKTWFLGFRQASFATRPNYWFSTCRLGPLIKVP